MVDVVVNGETEGPGKKVLFPRGYVKHTVTENKRNQFITVLLP